MVPPPADTPEPARPTPPPVHPASPEAEAEVARRSRRRAAARACLLVVVCLLPSLFVALDIVITAARRSAWIPDAANDWVAWCVFGWFFLVSIPASLVLVSPVTRGKPVSTRVTVQVIAAVACIYLNGQIAFGAEFLLA